MQKSTTQRSIRTRYFSEIYNPCLLKLHCFTGQQVNSTSNSHFCVSRLQFSIFLKNSSSKDAYFFPNKFIWLWFVQHHLDGIAHNLSFSHIQSTHTFWARSSFNQFTVLEQVITLHLFLESLQLFLHWLHLFWNFLFTKLPLLQVGKSINLLVIFTWCIYILLIDFAIFTLTCSMK